MSSERPQPSRKTLAEMREQVPACLHGRGACCAAVAAVIACILVLAGGGGAGAYFLFKDKLNFADFSAEGRAAETDALHWSDWTTAAIINTNAVYVTLQTEDGTSWTADADRFAQLALITAAVELEVRSNPEIRVAVPRVRCYLCTSNTFSNLTLVRSSAPPARVNDTTAFDFTFLGGTKQAAAFASTVRGFIANATVGGKRVFDGVSARISSILQLQHALSHDVLPNLAAIDEIAVPLGLVVLAAAVRGHPLLIVVPVLCILCSAAAAFGITYVVWVAAGYSKVTGFAIEIALALTAALSIDFTLFFTFRLREIHEEEHLRGFFPDSLSESTAASAGDASELLAEEGAHGSAAAPGTDRDEAARIVAQYAVWRSVGDVSHNILLTGVTVVAALACVCAVPSDFVKSIACCSAAAVACTTLCALTLAPALVYLFLYPLVFEGCLHRAVSRCWRYVAPQCCLAGEASQRGGEKSALLHQQRGARYAGAAEQSLSSASLPVVSPASPIAAASPLTVDAIAASSHFDDGGGAGPDRNGGVFFAPVAGFAARRPCVALVILLALALPFWVVGGMHIAYDDSYIASAPQNAEFDAFPSYTSTIEQFGNAVDTPFYLFFHSRDASTLLGLTPPVSAPPSNDDNPPQPQRYQYGLQIDNYQCYGEPIIFPRGVRSGWGNTPGTIAVAESLWPLLDFAVQQAIATFGPELLSLDCGCIDAPNVFEGRFISWNESKALLNANTTELLLAGRVADVERAWRYQALVKHVAGEHYERGQSIVIALRPRGAFNWGERNWALLDKLQQVSDIVHDHKLSPAFTARGNVSFPIFDLRQNPPVPFQNLSVSVADLVFDGYTGPNIDTWTAAKKVMGWFPLLVAMTTGVLFVLVAVLLRSVGSAVLCLVAVCYSVATAVGITTLLFHYGIWYPSASQYVPSYYWIILMICIVIAEVICLDYFLFIYVRLLQTRSLTKRAGGECEFALVGDRQAAVIAVCRAGPVAGVAAAIMLLALGALAFANTSMIQQFALSTSLAVVVCAYVCLPLLIPAVFSLAAGTGLAHTLLFWPRRVPAEPNDE